MVLLIVVGLLVAVGAVAAWRFDALVNGVKDKELTALSAKLGRNVTLGHLGVRLFPRPGVSLERLSIGPERGNGQDRVPALELAKAHLEIAWSTLTSLGARPRVTIIESDGLTVNVVRYPDGTLNLQHIAEKLSSPRPTEPPSSSAPPAAARAAIVDQLRFAHGTFRFFDRRGEAPDVAIREVTLTGEHLGAGQRFTMSLSAAVAADAPNFQLDLKAAPAPEGSVVSILEDLTLAVKGIDLGPFAPYLAATAPALADLESARAEGTLALHAGAFAPGGEGALALKGGLALKSVKMKGGQPFDVALTTDVSGDNPSRDLGDASLNAKELSLRFGTAAAPMALVAKGSVSHLATAPRFDGLDVHSEGLDFDKLAALWPSAFARTGLALGGPFAVEAKAHGTAESQTLDASLDFAQATLAVPGQFRKPAGVPLRAELQATTEKDEVNLKHAALTLADWRLEAQGTIKDLKSEAPRVDLTAAAQAPGISGLLRLLPPVAAALPAEAKLAGSLTVEGAAQGTSHNLSARVRVALAGLNVKVPEARLGGGGEMKALVEAKGAQLHAEAHADFAALEAVYTDVLRKTAGTPLGFDVRFDKNGAASTDRKAVPKGGNEDVAVSLDLQAATLVAHGHAESHGDAFRGDFDVPPFRVRGLGAMLPQVRTLSVGDVQAGAHLEAVGKKSDPDGLRVTVDPLTLKGTRTDVRGKAVLRSASHPEVDVELSGPFLDVDEVLPPTPKSPATRTASDKTSRAPAAELAAGPSPLAALEGRARLDVKRVRASAIDFSNLEGDFALSHGLATARALRVGVFGGTFEGSGTEIDLAAPSGSGKVHAKGALKNIDIAAALARFAGTGDLLQGRLSADVDLTSAGTTPEILASTLDGLLRGRLDKAVFPAASLAGDLARPLAQRVSALGGGNKADPEAWAQKLSDKTLGDLDLGLKVADGAMAFTKPLETKTAYGPATLSGRVLLRGAFDLKGTLSLSAESVNALLGNRVALDQPLPIVVSVTGPLRTPHVAPANLDTVVRVLAEGLARAAARQAATGAAKNLAAAALDKAGLKASPDDVKTARAEAEAKAQADLAAKAKEAEAQKAEAEAKLRAQAEAARQDAEKAKAEAQARADEEARRQADVAAAKAAQAKAQADEARKAAESKARDKLRGMFGN